MASLVASLLAATPVSFTQSFTALLDASEATCRARNHTVIGSEHLLHALAASDDSWSAIVPFLQAAGLAKDASFRTRVLAALDELPFFRPRPQPAGAAASAGTNAMPSSEAPPPPPSWPSPILSNTTQGILRRVAALANKRTTAPTSTHDSAFSSPSTSSSSSPAVSEAYLVAAIFFGSTKGGSVASNVLAHCSDNLLTTETTQKALAASDPTFKVEVVVRVPPNSVTHRVEIETLPHDGAPIPASARRKWGSKGEGEEEEKEMKGEKALPRVEDVPKGPTATSNWVIPGHLLIGARPYSRADVEGLVTHGGVTTFVCLIGEYSSMDRYLSSYPLYVRDMARGFGTDFLFFPIRDMDVASERSLMDLVSVLQRRLLEGEVVFVHCLGGHGRTGMVVAILLCALYGLDADAACAYVSRVTSATRESDAGWFVEMPETHQQLETVRATAPYARMEKRFGR